MSLSRPFRSDVPTPLVAAAFAWALALSAGCSGEDVASPAVQAAWEALPDPLPWSLEERRAARDALAAFVNEHTADNPYRERAQRSLARLEREGALAVGDEFVWLPGGTFTMGVVSNEVGQAEMEAVTHPVGLKCKFQDPWVDETGSRQVTVPGFAIGRTEVTNAQFLACVAAGACSEPPHYDDEKCLSPYKNGWEYQKVEGPLRAPNHPVVCIEWGQADQVCRWLTGCEGEGCGLPTEARWEYAARGTGGQNRMYPWGDARDVWNHGNYCDSLCPCPWRDEEHTDGYPYTAPVGSFPSGATPEGLQDMGGNAWEWVRDFYVGGYAECGEPCSGDDPKGPPVGEERVIRSGGWSCGACHLRTTERDGNDPMECLATNGVRCAVPLVVR